MRFDLVAFDLYGTLLAIEKLEAALAGIVGADARKLLADWRKAQLARTWELTSAESTSHSTTSPRARWRRWPRIWARK